MSTAAIRTNHNKNCAFSSHDSSSSSCSNERQEQEQLRRLNRRQRRCCKGMRAILLLSVVIFGVVVSRIQQHRPQVGMITTTDNKMTLVQQQQQHVAVTTLTLQPAANQNNGNVNVTVTTRTVSTDNNHNHKVPRESKKQQEPPLATEAVAEASDLHFSNVTLLRLLDWEVKSLEGLLKYKNPNMNKNNNDQGGGAAAAATAKERQQQKMIQESCQTPQGVLAKCCLGSSSSGGGNHERLRPACALAMQTGFAALQQHVDDYYRQHVEQTKQSRTTTTRKTMACDVCRIVELSKQRNLSIALVGDSFQSQVFDGLMCELQRRRYQVTVTTEQVQPRNKQRGGGTFRTVLSQKKTLFIQSPAWQQQHESNHNNNNNHQSTTTATNTADPVQISFFGIYKLPFTHEDERSLVASAADILVMGWGLHWNRRALHKAQRPANYVSSMADFLRTVDTLGRVRLLVHRESSAQHFMTTSDGSYVQQVLARAGTSSCVPHTNPHVHALWTTRRRDGGTNASILQNHVNGSTAHKRVGMDMALYSWREDAFRQAAAQAGFVIENPMMNVLQSTNNHNKTTTTTTSINTSTNNNAAAAAVKNRTRRVVVLPYFDFSAPHYDQHTSVGTAVPNPDCTHFCYSPYIFYPLWTSLRSAMDQTFGP